MGESYENRLFEYSIQDIKQKFYLIPSIRLVRFAREYISKRENYTIEQWKNDVINLPQSDENVRKWIEYRKVVYDLRVSIVDDGISENDFYSIIRTFSEDEMYVDEYCTEILTDLTIILNYVVVNNWNFKRFLETIKLINMFEYSHCDTIRNYIETVGHQGYPGIYDNIAEEATKKYFEKCDKTELAYLYMNSYIRFIVPFYDFIIMLDENKQIEDFTKDYTLKAIVECENTKWAKSTRNRLFLKPLGVYVDMTYAEAAKRAHSGGEKKYFKKIIRNDEEWFSKKSKYAELIKYNDICEYKIHSVRGGIILATDISNIDSEVTEERKLERDSFANDILRWLDEIIVNTAFIKWKEETKYYSVINIRNFNARADIALKILEVIKCLIDQNQIDQLEIFVNAITRELPYESSNEFRIIRYEEHNLFFIKDSRKREKIIDLGNAIFNSNIDNALKLCIYSGTCLKKHYLLEKVLDSCFDKELWDLYYAGLAIPVGFKETRNGVDYYTTRYNNNVYFTKYDICLDKAINNRNEVVFCRVMYKDDNKKIIKARIIDRRKEKAPDEIIRKLFDIKHDLQRRDFVKKGLIKYKETRMNDDEILRFINELNNAFSTHKYSYNACMTIVETFDEVNPLLYHDYKYDNLEKRIREADTYDSLCESYEKLIMTSISEKNAYQCICTIYFESYFRLIHSYEKFLQDFEDYGVELKLIKNYCEYKYDNFIFS